MDGHRSFFDNSGILLYRKLNLHFNVGKIQCYIKKFFTEIFIYITM